MKQQQQQKRRAYCLLCLVTAIVTYRTIPRTFRPAEMAHCKNEISFDHTQNARRKKTHERQQQQPVE